MSNYMAYSYDEIVERLKNLLKTKDAWKDTVSASTGTVFIELVSYAVSILEYYLQRSFEERFTDSAQFWESLVRIGALINYKVRRPIGSVGTIRLYPGSVDTTIPAGTQLQIGDMDFYFTETVEVKTTDNYVDTVVRQGTPFTVTFNGPYSEFQEFIIGGESVTDRDLHLFVDSVEWTQVPTITDSSCAHCYELFTDIDKSLMFRFGTEKIGGLPPAYSTVTVTAYKTLGKQSNYYGTDLDVTLPNLNNITAELITPLTGGDDIETIEELRLNIPSEYRTRVGLISLADFYEYVRSLPGVAKVYVKDVKDSMDVPFRTVSLYIIPEGGYELSDTQKTEIENALDIKCVVGVKYNVYRPLFREVIVEVHVNVKKGYSVSSVKTNVENALRDLYSVTNLSFGKWVTISEIYNRVMGVDGVFACTVISPHYNINTMKDHEFLKLKDLIVVAI